MTDQSSLIAAKIAGATTRTIKVSVSLRGDLRDRYDELTEQIAALSAGARLGDARVTELETEREQVQREAAESALTFTLAPISTKRARVVQAKLGPDAQRPDQMMAVARACIVEPKPTDDEWDALMFGTVTGEGTDDEQFTAPLVAGGDQADLMLAANDLVFGNSKSVPTLPAASAASRDSSTN